MNVLIIYNPISSSGNTKEKAKNLANELSLQNVNNQVIESKRKISEYQNLDKQLKESSHVVVVGGDGTLRKLLRILAKLKKPVYMIPGGNESLFAKVYGMNNDYKHIAKLIKDNSKITQHFGNIRSTTFNGKKPFFTMASLGLDSLTVKKIGLRKGPVNDFIYMWYGLLSAIKLRHPKITLIVDGVKVIDKEVGYLIIANNPSYAKNISLVPQANAGKKVLHVGFIKNANLFHEFKKSLFMLIKKNPKLPIKHFEGVEINLTIHDESFPMQVDGDYFRDRDLEVNEELRFYINKNDLLVIN